MTDTTYQCERCLAYCDAAGVRLSPQPRYGELRFGVPDLLICVVCTGAQEARPAPPAPTERRIVGIERGCPPEQDLDFAPQHQDKETEFRAAADPATQNGAVLAHLRRHFGRWCSIAELEELSGSRRMNSRAADIRRLVDGEGLDVDQQNRPFAATGRLHSYYRLVRREDSERLRRIENRQLAVIENRES